MLSSWNFLSHALIEKRKVEKNPDVREGSAEVTLSAFLLWDTEPTLFKFCVSEKPKEKSSY